MKITEVFVHLEYNFSVSERYLYYMLHSLVGFDINFYNCLENKDTICIMDYPGGVVARLTKKAQLEALIYIEGICESSLSIITMLELKVIL